MIFQKSEKQIRGSRRGLTFSFQNNKTFAPGKHYRYLIEPKKHRITILPSKDGGNTVSRKKSGTVIKSLIDLRSREIREMVSKAERMEIQIKETYIYVQIIEKNADEKILKLSNLDVVSHCISIPKNLLKAAGGENISYDTGYLDGIESNERECIEREIPDVIRTISLFSGAGMLDKAFLDSPKFELVYAAEYAPDAVTTYRHNIGNHIEQADIRTLQGASLPKADVIIGGPPCQPFSNANRHERARGLFHQEGDMFYHYLRLVRECSVKAFLIENVPTLLSEKFRYYLDMMNEILPDFRIASRIITDCDLGGYTKRKRAIIVGSRIGEPVIPDMKLRPVKTVKEALLKVDDSWPNAADITKSSEMVTKKISMVPEGGNWKDLPEEYWTKSVHSNMYRRLDRNKPSIALANWRKYLLSPPKWDNSGRWDRILSVSEAAALQGCTKDFTFLGSLDAKQQMVANGVTAATGRFVRKILEALFFCNSPYIEI